MTGTTSRPVARASIDRALAAVLDFARLVAELAGPKEVLPALVRAAVEQLGADAAAALQLEGGATVVVTAAEGEPLLGWRGEVEVLDRSLGQQLQAACEGRYQDVHTLQLVSDTDLFGALVLFFERKEALDDEGLRVARGLANLTAVALAKAARYQALERALGERDQVQAQLRATVDSLHALIDTAGSVIVFLSPEGRALEFNRAAEQLYGKSRDEVVGTLLAEPFGSSGSSGEGDLLAEVLGGARLRSHEGIMAAASGKRHVLWNADRLVDARGVVLGVVAVGQDISERRALEQSLLQAQKMEAMGQLASGIAHDFNNVLMGIIGCAEAVLEMVPADGEARSFVDEIKEAGLRGAGLTRQLKAFAKPRSPSVEVVDLNEVVRKSKPLLAHVLAENVELLFTLDASDARVLADAGQLEQTLLNLVINAGDAMPEGGALTIGTIDRSADDARWVVLVVTDTGHGMDEAVKQRLFEPFFTTKEEGRGTGLGLAMVRGIVEQAGGKIDVESSPGAGSAFRLWFRHTDQPATTRSAEMAAPPRGANEVVLIVDDDPSVRMSIRRWLEDGGYRVLTAERGDEAAALLARGGEHLDVLVTDVRLPGLSGYEVVRAARELRPGLPILYVTAKSELRDDAGHDAVLVKPFRRAELLAAISKVLGRASTPPASLQRDATLLLVEDDALARRAIRRLLQDRFRIVDASSTGEALQQLEDPTMQVHAVLTDIQLPGGPVTSLVEQVRKRFPNVPVVFMSGHDRDDPVSVRVLGMPRSSFVPKPIDFDALIAAIEAALGQDG